MSDMFSSGDDEAPAPGLFGDAPKGEAVYTVLARKYRPRTFADLIGQEAMVRTLENAFATGRIAHAFMLTGVRGVGKTTTARLLARALNYRRGQINQPTINLDPLGEDCKAIMASSHPDVLEMDAASRTGIGDIREILDSVRYAPSMARRKIYIIDEVHMLSNQAFNGLLKTLEEPPSHVTFIFATTEIRKVPVTVLSRCQRFDLRRVDPDVLTTHLERICAAEGAKVDKDGLELIARAAEGSVRDALSLLDQAIVQNAAGSGAASAALIRDMLGLADRGRVMDLLLNISNGDAASALKELDSQYASGADPILVLRDLLELTHEVTRLKAAPDAKAPGASDHVARLKAMAQGQSLGNLSRLWQLLLKGHEEAQKAPDPLAAASMVLIRAAAAAALPPPEDAARLLAGQPLAARPAGNGNSAPQASGEPQAATQAPQAASPNPMRGVVPAHRLATAIAQQQAPSSEPQAWRGPETFDALLNELEGRREVDLQIDMETYMRVAEYAPGFIRFSLESNAPRDFAKRLRAVLDSLDVGSWRLENATHVRAETVSERKRRERQDKFENAANHPMVQDALSAFPGAKVIAVREAPPSAGSSAADTPDNVVSIDSARKKPRP
jgi:DNA polymerase-3 subunit gamma/tau